jgi:L,D-peptidoglycan transpeptidase YkuD (ErfK/YbiS/YcfS/YnhG family)
MRRRNRKHDLRIGSSTHTIEQMRRGIIPIVRIRTRPGQRSRGWLSAGPFTLPVALGRAGIKANKREGDGATPRGRFRLVRLWWRADRYPKPKTLLPVRRIGPRDSWCENPADRRYNRPMLLDRGGDRLWREDHLYDFIVELDHNTRPRIAGRGSAVFVHVARQNFGPTAGCVALEASRLKTLLPRLGAKTRIDIA